MGIFVKLAAMGAVVVGGSLLTLWLAFGGHLFLAWLALLAMVFLALALIVFIARASKDAPIDDGSSLAGMALAAFMHLSLAAVRRVVRRDAPVAAKEE